MGFDIRLETPFLVGDWLVEPELGRISRQNTVLRLEPKVMTVLLCLARDAGVVVSREQLETEAWEGRLVGYDSLATTIIKLRRAFDDNPKNSQVIETVPKRGYRLIAPVRLPAAEKTTDSSSVSSAVSTAPNIQSHPAKTYLSLTIAIIVLVGILAGLVLLSDSGNTKKPVVVVLPFKNIGSDPKQDYFSEGMTADLITDLSKLSGLAVISRNSSFAYAGQNLDVRQIGRDLDATYVIEGSVRKSHGTVRISARLIETATGHNIWAERFDGELNDVFAVQDRITSHIVKSLKVRLSDTERDQLIRRYTNSVEAYDLFLQGWRYFWHMSREGNIIARESYLKAIEMDDKFARAYANLALTYAYEYLNGWSEDPPSTIAKANQYAAVAVALDKQLPQVYWALGVIQTYSRNYKQALETSRKALALQPNYADGYGLLATVLNYAGKPKQALQAMEQAMRLNPRYPAIYRVMRGEIYFNMHNYIKAIDDFRFALQRNPEAQEPRLWLAAAYAYQGDIDEAQWQVEQLVAHNPQLSLAHFQSVIPLIDPSHRKHLIDGLFKAGLN